MLFHLNTLTFSPDISEAFEPPFCFESPLPLPYLEPYYLNYYLYPYYLMLRFP
jgi:hypothetical protein